VKNCERVLRGGVTRLTETRRIRNENLVGKSPKTDDRAEEVKEGKGITIPTTAKRSPGLKKAAKKGQSSSFVAGRGQCMEGKRNEGKKGEEGYFDGRRREASTRASYNKGTEGKVNQRACKKGCKRKKSYDSRNGQKRKRIEKKP